MNLELRKNMLLMIRALYFIMEEQWSELGKRYNITPAQQHILYLLFINDKVLTPTQISELGCWHTSTVTRLLKPLKESGYITVETDKSRPRYKLVTITEMGEDLIENLVRVVSTMESFPFDMNHLSEEEIKQFLYCGKRIIDVHKGHEFNVKVINAKIEGYGKI